MSYLPSLSLSSTGFGITRQAYTAMRTVARRSWGNPLKWLSYRSLMDRADYLPLLPMYTQTLEDTKGKELEVPHLSVFDVICRVVQYPGNYEQMVFHPSVGNWESTELWSVASALSCSISFCTTLPASPFLRHRPSVECVSFGV
jgi:hypothetical protein